MIIPVQSDLLKTQRIPFSRKIFLSVCIFRLLRRHQ
eukprot:UN15329